MTIADSKRAFHKAFPHVIPPIYRRITDELLVELHLLSHQKGFKPDLIFSIGLINVFDTFTSGYRPEEHLNSLFGALCRSNGLNPVLLREQSKNTLEAIKNSSVNEIESWLKNNGSGAPEELGLQVEVLSQGNSHYSRLMTIGLLTLLQESNKEIDKQGESINNVIKETSELFGFSISRVERDLDQYRSNLEKMSQAIELIKEGTDHDRRKKKANLESMKLKSKENKNEGNE